MAYFVRLPEPGGSNINKIELKSSSFDLDFTDFSWVSTRQKAKLTNARPWSRSEFFRFGGFFRLLLDDTSGALDFLSMNLITHSKDMPLQKTVIPLYGIKAVLSWNSNSNLFFGHTAQEASHVDFIC